MTEKLSLNTDDSWIDELYLWADKNNIPDLQHVYGEICDCKESYWVGLPRDRAVLLDLEELDLSWHSCTEIPEQLRHLNKLKKLSFAKSKDGLQPPFHENADGPGAIEEIPDWIGELEGLEELDLSGNNIMYVPKVIGALKKLKNLYLHDNNIMLVEPELGSLDNLEVLWIRNNPFSVLDDCIENIKKLAHIDVGWEQSNKLSVLKDCAGQIIAQDLTEYQYAELYQHRFATLQAGIAKLRALTNLDGPEDLWNAWLRLSDVKGIVRELPRLQELWV